MSIEAAPRLTPVEPWLRPGARFEVSVHSDSEYFWSSYLFCGLFDLVAEGEVRVKFLPRFSLTPEEIFGTELIVRDRRTQRLKRIVFDWRDNPLPVTITRRPVPRASRLHIVLAPGGGQAIRIRPAQ